MLKCFFIQVFVQYFFNCRMESTSHGNNLKFPIWIMFIKPHALPTLTYFFRLNEPCSTTTLWFCILAQNNCLIVDACCKHWDLAPSRSSFKMAKQKRLIRRKNQQTLDNFYKNVASQVHEEVSLVEIQSATIQSSTIQSSTIQSGTSQPAAVQSATGQAVTIQPIPIPVVNSRKSNDSVRIVCLA